MGLSSCALPFRKEWKAASPTETGMIAPSGPVGKWEGTWESDRNGHSGLLRCVITPQGEDRYQFRYYAEWGPGLRGSFLIDCEAKLEAGVYGISGAKKLPIGGTYSHTGTLSGDRFEATFTKEGKGKNLGTFELQRISPTPQ
ncbi:MAG: hypothetical protein AAGJ31_10260 [Verrucomicrobiota bacterium]